MRLSTIAGMTKYVIPPPEFPHPPVIEFAVPTTFLSKNPVDHTWQGTNEPPRMPTKNLRTMSPVALDTVPASAVGMAPASRHPAKVTLGPKRSHDGPATKRTRSLSEAVSF